MGCFSYVCPFCGKGIKSTSFDGEKCEIFLLDQGAIVETMKGRYDSYGRVFKKGGSHKIIKQGEGTSQIDETSFSWEYAPWNTLVDMHFGDDDTTGFVAVHSSCKPKDFKPTMRSADDPNQGWGDNGELMGETGKIPKKKKKSL